MWIVRLALRRPYTVAVGAILIFLLGALAIRSMIVDIFPVVDIPVVTVIWSYNGLSAEDMERRIVFISERSISTTVDGVSKIESQSIDGVAILRVYFDEGVNIGSAIAQMTAVSGTILRIAPPGTTPPAIIPFNAANVPVVQMTLSSDTLSEEEIFDYALNFIRVKLFTIPGLSVPGPNGGRNRQINVDIDPARLTAKGLSPIDVVNALQASNIILPAGAARLGDHQYTISLNASPSSIAEFDKTPIKIVNNAPVTIGSIGKTVDGSADQSNIVRINGKRSAFLNILKKSSASTLDVVNAVKAILPEIRANAPKGLDITLDFDQSIFVKAAVQNVVLEAFLATLLVSLMVLLFLGSWRSTLVICTSIPLAILSAIVGLKLTGNSLNIMTLGGLSLAVGMLVDDATVEVENIHRNRDLGKPLVVAILNSAQQVALPAIMATLAICIVFLPVGLLTGPARFLFTPMALSVAFAMIASYILSRTLVPQLSRTLMGREKVDQQNFFTRFFDKFQSSYSRSLALFLQYRAFVLWVTLAFLLVTTSLVFSIGYDFFPKTDAGLIKMHFKAPPGTRLEKTEELIAKVEARIKAIIPQDELQTINSEIGTPIFFNLAFARTDSISSRDADILIGLTQSHSSTVEYMKALRTDLAKHFPGCTIYFQSADIISQVLNFGLTAPIDIQFEGANTDITYALAKKLKDEISLIPGVVDINIKQDFDAPVLNLNIDRLRAAQLGLTTRDVANSLLISLTSNSQVAPVFYLNRQNNINYFVNAKFPMREIISLDDILSTTVSPSAPGIPRSSTSFTPAAIPTFASQRLGNIASVTTSTQLNGIRHRNVQRLIDMTANVEGRDLGSVVSEIQTKINALGELPTGTTVTIRGQNEVMNEAFAKLGVGILLALLLIYLLMVVLFQSWLDPFIVLVAIPGAFAGILWMLALTGTTINVQSLMGSIMAIGIAASNSILLVSFANDARIEHNMSAVEAALYAGTTRLRPVLMTALAMILGMLPAAIGLGEGGEQIAPLGRAVIGGLTLATVITLFIVPVIYSLLRKGEPVKHLLDERLKQEESQGAA